MVSPVLRDASDLRAMQLAVCAHKRAAFWEGGGIKTREAGEEQEMRISD